MTTARPHVLVIDPAMRIAEVECFNLVAQMATVPCTYHLPAMFGMQSLQAEDMGSVLGIIILGSAASVHDRSPWQHDLEGWLMPHLRSRIPTIGFCYGHQMLAHMFGGRVDYVFADRTKHSGMREIQVDHTPWHKAGSGRIVVSHCETVVQAPAAMRVLAKSPEITVDGLAHVDLPIWSLQSHPESTPAFLANHEIKVVDPARELAFGHGIVRGFLDYATRTPKPA